MNKQRISVPTVLMSVFLAVLVSFSCVMCLNDAFGLDVQPFPLLAVCVAASVLSALSSLLKRSWPCGLLTAVVCVFITFRHRDAFFDSLMTVVHEVTWNLSLAFDRIRVVGEAAGDPLWVLMALSAPLAWLTAWVMSREGSAAAVILSVLPVLVLVLLVVDLAPVLWLILLTGGLMIVVMSSHARERSRTEGSLLAWWLVLPTIILLCAVTVLWPPADYQRADWSEAMRALTKTEKETVTRIETWQQSIVAAQPRWSRELKTVNLKQLGPKTMTGIPVLRYRTDGELHYLRGVSLAVYEDSAWNALEPDEYEAYDLPDAPLLTSAVKLHTLEIETEVRKPQLYTTYFMADTPEGGGLVDDAYVQNMERLTVYTLQFEPSLQYPMGTSDAADDLAATVYTRVPDALHAPLTAILAEHGLNDASAEAIAAFVKSSGTYDLSTPGLPEGEDFVLYFLQESHRGYCVHFASAAVLLLRTAGIPARYVTGYAANGPMGQWNQVTEDDAHAWVEYYVNGVGWRPLDPTPVDENPEPLAPAEPTEPEPEPDKPNQKDEPDVPKPERPITTAPANQPPKSTKFLWLLLLPESLLLLWLRRWFGNQYRRSRCEKGHPNRRALSYWRWLVRLSRADGIAIEEELLCLAEKAKFSQHTMNEAELAQLQQAAEERIHHLKTAPLRKRLWWKYGSVLF